MFLVRGAEPLYDFGGADPAIATFSMVFALSFFFVFSFFSENQTYSFYYLRLLFFPSVSAFIANKLCLFTSDSLRNSADWT
jgi:hypothetical protein